MVDQVEPERTPLYRAEHAGRYERQDIIRRYQESYSCRLIVLVDAILNESVTLFEELLYDADPAQDMHLLLNSGGGLGDIAVRLVRSAQARCKELTVIVPDVAKSAATLLAIGAHHILMGPASDLGPVDPQFVLPNGGFGSAKDIIAAVSEAENAIEQRPETYPLHAALLGQAGITDLMVQQARSALDRTGDQVEEALRANSDRTEQQVALLKAQLQEPLIDRPKSHVAIFGADAAEKAGLPVMKADPGGEQWRTLWGLWARYFYLGQRVYEGERASRVIPHQAQ